MKRQIKFRGKRLENGEWVYGDLTTKQLSPRFIGDHCIFDGEWHVVDPDTLGQFTGLNDAHGTEIYEGDILRGEYTTYDGTHELLYKIDWADCGGQRYVGFDFYPINEEAENLDTPKVDWIQGDMEIIGNIHDNPEMMKRK